MAFHAQKKLRTNDSKHHRPWKSSQPNTSWLVSLGNLGMIHGSRIPDPSEGQAVWSTWTSCVLYIYNHVVYIPCSGSLGLVCLLVHEWLIVMVNVGKHTPFHPSLVVSSGPLVDLDRAITAVVILLQQLIRLRNKRQGSLI